MNSTLEMVDGLKWLRQKISVREVTEQGRNFEMRTVDTGDWNIECKSVRVPSTTQPSQLVWIKSLANEQSWDPGPMRYVLEDSTETSV